MRHFTPPLVILLTMASPASAQPATADATNAPPSSPTLVVTARDHQQTPGAPSVPMLSARLGTATVEVQLSGYPFNCAPVPEFAATLERGTLVLTQTPATGPLARCVGVHRMTLDVATPASPDRVKVVDLVGRVFAEAAIPGK